MEEQIIPTIVPSIDSQYQTLSPTVERITISQLFQAQVPHGENVSIQPLFLKKTVYLLHNKKICMTIYLMSSIFFDVDNFIFNWSNCDRNRSGKGMVLYWMQQMLQKNAWFTNLQQMCPQYNTNSPVHGYSRGQKFYIWHYFHTLWKTCLQVD